MFKLKPLNFLFILILLGFNFGFDSKAENSASESVLTLPEAINRLWNESSQLKAQKQQVELASVDRWRRYLINEPQFTYTNSDNNTAQSYGLQLTTSFPGKAFAMAKSDEVKSRSQIAEYSSKKYDLAKMLVQAYLDCAVAQETLDLQQKTVRDTDTLFHSLKMAYEMGHSTQAEKIGAELQARQAENDLVATQDKVEVLCKKLNTLLGDKEKQISAVKVPEDLDAKILQELGSRTADQERSLAAIEQSQVTSDLAGWSQAPDLTFSVARNHYLYLPGSPSGAEWTTNYGISLTLPLLFPFNERVEFHRARSQSLIDKATAEQQKIAADSDQLDGRREYERSRKRLKELRHKDFPLAMALVDSTYSAYKAGKLGFAELVMSRKTLVDLKMQEIQLRSSIVSARLRCLSQCEAID
ncbi:MAG: TolC family protein [Pseudobdellovibrionaceae bacterium]